MATPLKTFIRSLPELREMPRVEVRALKQKCFRTCLSQLRESLEGEELQTLTCATSASKGRGVLGLTSERLILFTDRSGMTEWHLADIDAVRIRPARFTYPAAIYLELAESTQALLVGVGRTWGPVFSGVVRDALGPSLAAAA